MGMRSPGLETCNGRYSTCWLGIWTCMNTVFWAWTSHYTTLCTTLLLTYSRCENIRFVQWKIMIDKDFFMWLKRIVYIVHDASLAFFILLNPRFWVSHLIFFSKILFSYVSSEFSWHPAPGPSKGSHFLMITLRFLIPFAQPPAVNSKTHSGHTFSESSGRWSTAMESKVAMNARLRIFLMPSMHSIWRRFRRQQGRSTLVASCGGHCVSFWQMLKVQWAKRELYQERVFRAFQASLIFCWLHNARRSMRFVCRMD